MSKKDKLVKRLKMLPNDFTYEELKQLLKYYGYHEIKSGKTSGSAVKFYNESNEKRISIHKPHPGKIVKKYILCEVINVLEKEDSR